MLQVRTLKEEVGMRAARVTHLEHVLRARERELNRFKEERDAGRAAERERARVSTTSVAAVLVCVLACVCAHVVFLCVCACVNMCICVCVCFTAALCQP